MIAAGGAGPLKAWIPANLDRPLSKHKSGIGVYSGLFGNDEKGIQGLRIKEGQSL
jgi:hypothetical protein